MYVFIECSKTHTHKAISNISSSVLMKLLLLLLLLPLFLLVITLSNKQISGYFLGILVDFYSMSFND